MDFSDMRAYFEAGRTLDPAARIESLRALEAAIRASEGEIFQALQADLGKAPLEAYMTEIGMVLEELRYQIRHVRAFSRPRRVRTTTPVTRIGKLNLPSKNSVPTTLATP